MKINSNGHSALHKAAQRGNKNVCKWLLLRWLSPATAPIKEEEHAKVVVDTTIGEKITTPTTTTTRRFNWTLSHIAPDGEGCCPSDLCGMEGCGGGDLAEEIAEIESAMVRYLVDVDVDDKQSQTCPKNDGDDHQYPEWLSAALENERMTNGKYKNCTIENKWGPGQGARRIALTLLYGNNALPVL
jgi:hypothetical protein